MATLTKTQITHAQQRIYEAKQAYIGRHTELLGTMPKVTPYTDKEKLEMIKRGVATLKCTVNDCYGYITAAFEYPITKANQANAAALLKWQAASKAVEAKAKKLENALLDELIMSSDGAAALARITAVFA